MIDTQEASWGLAQALVNSGQTEQAIQCMNEALEKNPRQFEMALLLGTTQLQFGRPDEALQTLLPWSRTWPEDVELNYAIGQALQHWSVCQVGLQQEWARWPMFTATKKL